MDQQTASSSADDVTSDSTASRLCRQLRHYRANLSLESPSVEGRLMKVLGLTLEADGCRAALGEHCRVASADGSAVDAEVVGFADRRTLLMPVGVVTGMQSQAAVKRVARAFVAPSGDALLGRVIDAQGHPIDGRGPIVSHAPVPLVAPAINPLARGVIDEPFDVGVRAINGLLTLGRGQRIGLFAGSGVGKSTLLGMMTRHSNADVTIIALIGERGREVHEFVHDTLGTEAMRSAVVVAVPADQPPLSRLHGALLATAIAESFRATGKQVLLLMDSLTRFAQAQREIGLATGEPPTSKGYPPSVFALLPRLVERAGKLHHGGSITGIYTVLAEGDDQNDPVADAARAVLDGHIVLSRHLSDAAHFPAIDIGASVSRTRSAVTTKEQQQLVRQCLQLSATYRSQEDMLRVGMYKSGTDPVLDRSVRIWPRLQRFLQQDATEGVSLDDAAAALADVLATSPEN